MKRADLLLVIAQQFQVPAVKVGKFVFTKQPTVRGIGWQDYKVIYHNGLFYVPIHNAHAVRMDNYLWLQGDTLRVISQHFITHPPDGVKLVISPERADEFASPKDGEVLLVEKWVELPQEFLQRRFAGWAADWLSKDVRKKLTTGNRWIFGIEWGTVPLFRERTKRKIFQTFFGQYEIRWKKARPYLWKDFVQSWVIDVCNNELEKCPEALLSEVL